MQPTTAIIMLVGFTTAHVRRSTTSILVNIPGETSSCNLPRRLSNGAPGRAGAQEISAFGCSSPAPSGDRANVSRSPSAERHCASGRRNISLTLTGLTLVAYLTQGSLTKRSS
jgi:hypothetical protein